jgi:hypothetical protein
MLPGSILLLADCATQQQAAQQQATTTAVPPITQAQQTWALAANDCYARHSRGELRTYRETGLCVNNAQMRIVWPVEPYGDLLAQEMAYRLVLSDDLDRKLITFDEAIQKMNQFRSGLGAKATKRQGG